jgi:GH43 family beta-xylosidase
VFLVYSASASWEITYKLGLLELDPGADPMNPRAWRKRSTPLFQATSRTWGPGHNCFTTSPDGQEDWLVFHAKLETKPNWNRAIHVQRFTWDETGAPVLGEPIDPGVALALPSGEDTREPALADAAGEEVALGRAALAAVLGEAAMITSVSVSGA